MIFTVHNLYHIYHPRGLLSAWAAVVPKNIIRFRKLLFIETFKRYCSYSILTPLSKDLDQSIWGHVRVTFFSHRVWVNQISFQNEIYGRAWLWNQFNFDVSENSIKSVKLELIFNMAAFRKSNYSHVNDHFSRRQREQVRRQN